MYSIGGKVGKDGKDRMDGYTSGNGGKDFKDKDFNGQDSNGKDFNRGNDNKDNNDKDCDDKACNDEDNNDNAFFTGSPMQACGKWAIQEQDGSTQLKSLPQFGLA